MKPSAKWRTAPISAVCEHCPGFPGKTPICGRPTTHAYEAMGRGWMALCYEHAQKHLPYAKPITELFLRGETIIARDVPTGPKPGLIR